MDAIIIGVRTLIAGFAKLSNSDRRLVAGVALLQLATACAVRVLPVSTLRRRAGCGSRLAQLVSRGLDARVIWAVETCGRHVPGATCLVNAIVIQMLLGTRARPVSLTIGIRRLESGAFAFHAWARREGRTIVGGGSLDYTPIVTWDQAT